jgi:large subunit ribosomal protein L37Ae
MAEVQKLGSVRRFGARYGRKPKKKLAKIEKELRKKQKCPYCSKVQVKRLSAGIWYCKKCRAKFTGKAYSVKKKITTEEPLVEEKAEKEGT